MRTIYLALYLVGVITVMAGIIAFALPLIGHSMLWAPVILGLGFSIMGFALEKLQFIASGGNEDEQEASMPVRPFFLGFATCGIVVVLMILARGMF